MFFEETNSYKEFYKDIIKYSEINFKDRNLILLLKFGFIEALENVIFTV